MAKKIVLGVLGAVVLGVVGLLVVAVMQPDQLHVERSREIAAPPAAIQPHFTDLELWAEWNPWSELDPNMERTFSDPPAGQGAWYAWSGNEDVGRGRMEITEVTPNLVRYHLEFIEPFASESEVTMRLEPEGEGTRVVWAMDGENDFVSKLFSVFMDMDEMIGSDFDRGLSNLDQVLARSRM